MINIKYFKNFSQIGLIIVLGLLARILFLFLHGMTDISTLSFAPQFLLHNKELSFLQLVSILSDGGIVGLIYIIARDYLKKNKEESLRFAKWYAFNPIPLFIISFQGLYEPIWLFLFLLSWYLIFKKKNLGSFILAIPFFQTLPTIFLFPLFIFRIKGLRSKIMFAVPSLFLLAISFLISPWALIQKRILTGTVQEVWGLSFLISKAFLFLGIYKGNLSFVSILFLLGVFILVVLYLFFTRKPNFFHAGAELLIIFLIFTPLFGPQYLLWLLPFLILSGNRFLGLFTILTTMIFVVSFGFPIIGLDYLGFFLNKNFLSKFGVSSWYSLFFPLWLFLFIISFWKNKFSGAIIQRARVIFIGFNLFMKFLYEKILRLYRFVTSSEPLNKTTISGVFVFYLVLILLFYFKSLFGYFQADEWYYFTQFLPLTKHWYGIFATIYKSLSESYSVSGGGHLAPVYNVLWFLHNQIFGLNFLPYITLSVIVHAINSVLIFIFIEKLTKNRSFAFISSIFFSLSYVHYQAITWVMAYIPTEISVTFFLLTLIKTADIINYKKFIPIREIRLLFIFFILALLTKETSVILFVLIPLIFFLKKRQLFRGILIKYYLTLALFYLPYRFGLPQLFLWIDKLRGHLAPVSVTPIDPALIVFRIVTYPLRMLTEVFVPREWIQVWVENLTPLAYPTYGAEKAVRGINFLTFTESAGSDTVIYLLAFILLTIVIYTLRKSVKEKNISDALIFGLLVIILSVFPLILIATYAPAWGYITFFDPRHIYIASIGGAILFSIVLIKFSKWIEKKVNVSGSIVGISLVLVWAIFNYKILQNKLNQQAETAFQRKTVINKILNTVPINLSRKVILIESNIGYYGFKPMPPFETNLGQILSVHYYQKRQLPEFFIKNDFLTKNGLVGQGYGEKEGKGFGYFIEEKELLKEIGLGRFKPSDIYAFSWDGTTDTIIDTTDKVRNDSNKRLVLLSQFKDWKTFFDSTNNFKISYPSDMNLSELKQTETGASDVARDIEIYTDDLNKCVDLNKYGCEGLYLRITLLKKPETLGSDNFARLFKNSEGDIIGNNYTFRVVRLVNGDDATTVYVTKSKYFTYFVPFNTHNLILKISAYGTKGERVLDPITFEQKWNKDIEKIISTINEDK